MAGQRNLCFLKHGYVLLMDDDMNIELLTRTMDGCLILNKLGRRRRVKMCQRVMATLQC